MDSSRWGGVDKNEEPEDAARREALEELGLRLENLRQVTTFTTYEEYKEDTVHSFSSETSSKNFTIETLEVDRAEWFSFEDLPEIGSVSSRILDAYKN